jgi:hypothetical protein
MENFGKIIGVEATTSLTPNFTDTAEYWNKRKKSASFDFLVFKEGYSIVEQRSNWR